MTRIKVDTSKAKTLGDERRQATIVGLRRIMERGEQLTREEAPRSSGNLKQGISSDVRVTKKTVHGEITAAARTRTAAGNGVLHLPSGKTRRVRLRPTKAYDYALAVAGGTGTFGPRKAVITPRKRKALLIPVDVVPIDSKTGKPEAYIDVNGRSFILRRSSKGMKPNPFDERAARRLEGEAQAIMNTALENL
jgi:hypothetical protein